MTDELYYLALTASLTAFMWVPYVLNRFASWGLRTTFGNRENPPPMAPWAERAKRAHSNAIENLVVFGLLVLAAHAIGVQNHHATAPAAMMYFWARAGHYVVYTLGIPYVRTALFLVGFMAQFTFGWYVVVGG